MQPTASPCRDGLPFFSFVEYNMTAEACLDFCLGKGFDLFGVLSNLECRCGGSAGNEGAWQKKKKRRELLLPLNSIQACSGTEALKVYRYTGHFVAGSVPSMALRLDDADISYVGSVLAGGDIMPDIGGDDISNAYLGVGTKVEEGTNTSMLQGGELRACTGGSQCGPGKPWPLRFPTPQTSPVEWEEIVGISYHFKQPADQSKKEDFRLAAQHVMEKTCIRFQEIESGSQVEVLTIQQPQQYCKISPVLGDPGAGNMISVEVSAGYCTYGNMIHEILHVVGLSHTQKRPDAYREFSGHGPYLRVHWDIVNFYAQYGLPGQFKANEESYVGSANDGPGDPYSGWAPYDFSSIMHYDSWAGGLDPQFSGKGFFDTIPPDRPVGQRSHMSDGDVLSILDMYQCKKRTH